MASAILACISDESIPWGDQLDYGPLNGNSSAAAERLRPTELVKSSNAIRCTTVAFEKYMLYGGFKEIKVFEIDTGIVTTAITGDFGWVNHLSVVHGATTLIASAHDDGSIRTWDMFGDQYIAYAARPMHELNGHFKRATSTAVVQGASPLVISGSLDGTLRVWDLELEQPVAFSFHRKGITCVVASSESPVLIASGDEDGEVIIWTITYPELEMKIRKKDGQITFGADRIKPTLKPHAAVKLSDSAITCLNIIEKNANVSERLLLIAREDGNVCVRRMTDGALLFGVAASGSTITGLSALLVPGTSTAAPVSQLDSVISGDKRLVLLTTCRDSVRIWDAVRCELLGSCFGHAGEVLSVCSVLRRVRKMKRPKGLGSRSESSDGSIFSFTSMLQAAGMINISGAHSDGSTSSDDDSYEFDDEYNEAKMIKHSPKSASYEHDCTSFIDNEIESTTNSDDSLHYIISTGADGKMFGWEFYA